MTNETVNCTAMDYLSEWLMDAASDRRGTDDTVHSTDATYYNIMYQIAETVYREVFPAGSLKVYARNYIVWDDSIYPHHDTSLYDSYIEVYKRQTPTDLFNEEVDAEEDSNHKLTKVNDTIILNMDDI